MLVKTTIEKLKLGYIIIPIVATLAPLIPSKNSHRKAYYKGLLLSSLHFDGVGRKPKTSGRNSSAA
jgi:hypothetical protein